ncbi:MAG: hypothetical protein JXR48_07795 [Candidatus Delongbacteria bacterium]|nr:hypothetical protein [Candidatus Delongbacteria bacterium]MBN2834854.1 hypothetical protein [Candidatus Delongbacteria bacterium]
MKTYIIIILTLIFSLMADEMSNDAIKSCYSESYKFEKAQNYTEAIRAMMDVYNSYPNTYTVNYRLGWLFYLNGNYANAKKHLNASLLVNPSSVEVMNTIALVYAAQEEWLALEELTLQVMKIDYYNHYANYWNVYSLKMQKKYDLGEKAARKMLAIVPASITFLSELGEIMYFSEKYEDSYSLFNSVIILDPYNQAAKYYLNLLKK